MSRTAIRFVSVCTLMSTAISTASAQESTERVPGSAHEGFRTVVEASGFVPWSVLGTVRVGDQQLAFEADAGDVIDHLEGFAEGRIELWLGRFGVIVDGIYTALGRDGSIGPPEMRVPYDVDVSRLSGDFMAAAVIAGDHVTSLELAAGVRAETNDLEIDLGPTTMDADERSLKFVAAAQVPFRVSKHWRLRARGLVAVPDDVVFAFEGIAVLRLEPVELGLGYRYDSIDVEGDRAALDVRTHSVFLSLGASFGDGT